jgi:hypothetical protein
MGCQGEDQALAKGSHRALVIPHKSARDTFREGYKCCLLSKLLLDGEKICYTERQMLIFVWGLEK